MDKDLSDTGPPIPPLTVDHSTTKKKNVKIFTEKVSRNKSVKSRFGSVDASSHPGAGGNPIGAHLRLSKNRIFDQYTNQHNYDSMHLDWLSRGGPNSP